MLLGVTLMVGARTYPLGKSESRWLAGQLEARYGGKTDVASRAGAQVGKAIGVALEDGNLELLELGRSQVEPVRRVLAGPAVEKSARLAALTEGLQRYED